MLHEFINFKHQLAEMASIINHGYNKGMLAVDINCYGIHPYYSDPENGSIYRRTLIEMAHELFEYDTEKARENARYQDALADEMTLNGR